MVNEKVKEILVKFCEMMLDKEPEVQSVKIHVELKNKSNIKFKKFRGS